MELQHNVTYSPVSLWCWGGVGLQHRPCDVMFCMSVGLGVGWSYNTDHVKCCPVCMWNWGGVKLQHRPLDVLSCMYVGLGWGGVKTHTV